MAASRRCLARAQAERAKRGAEKKEKAPVTQWRWLLTVIHNPLQQVFLEMNLGAARPNASRLTLFILLFFG
jgi:hypothetical protein